MSDGPVYLHIGLKKTGTSYLQSLYRANNAALEAQGLSMVPANQVLSRQLVRALKGQLEAGIDGPRARRSLKRLPGELDEAAGDRILITDEVLGGCSPDQVARLGRLLGGREPHVLLTVRDIARTIPSAWQQTIKGGSQMPYERFVEAVIAREGEAAAAFWHAYDVPALLERWQGLVAPERTNLVVLPPPGAAPTVLLERFSRVLGVDPATLTPERVRANESIGRPQAELLRRLNGLLSDRSMRRDVHGAVLKRGFAIGVLAPQQGDRIPMPLAHREWCEQYADQTIATLEKRGYAVAGDLEELRPHDTAFSEELDEIPEEAVTEAALRALTTILDEKADKFREHREANRAAAREANQRK